MLTFFDGPKSEPPKKEAPPKSAPNPEPSSTSISLDVFQSSEWTADHYRIAASKLAKRNAGKPRKKRKTPSAPTVPPA